MVFTSRPRSQSVEACSPTGSDTERGEACLHWGAFASPATKNVKNSRYRGIITVAPMLPHIRKIVEQDAYSPQDILIKRFALC